MVGTDERPEEFDGIELRLGWGFGSTPERDMFVEQMDRTKPLTDADLNAIVERTKKRGRPVQLMEVCRLVYEIRKLWQLERQRAELGPNEHSP